MWRIIVAVFVSVMCVSCPPPSPEPDRFGTVKISLGPSLSGGIQWRQDQADALEPLARELDALGPDFVWSSPGDPDSIVIRPEMLSPGTCGLYRLGEPTVSVDPACTLGYSALRKSAAHEILHALLFSRFGWRKHLCWYPLNSPVPQDCHPSLVCRDCLMSPGVQDVDTWGDSIEDYSPSVAIPDPQAQDIELVRRCFSTGRCE